MINAITETEKAVVETIRMRLPREQALAYLQGVGHGMKKSTYYRYKHNLEQKKLQRLHFIAQIGYEDQHLERIDQLELAQKLMWQNYHLEKNPFKKVLILEKIVNVQPYLSAYYDSTKAVMTKNQNDSNSKPTEEDSPLS